MNEKISDITKCLCNDKLRKILKEIKGSLLATNKKEKSKYIF